MKKTSQARPTRRRRHRLLPVAGLLVILVVFTVIYRRNRETEASVYGWVTRTGGYVTFDRKLFGVDPPLWFMKSVPSVYFQSIHEIAIKNTNDLSPLLGLSQIKSLTIATPDHSPDLLPVATLQSLQELSIHVRHLDSLSKLDSLTSLTRLELHNTDVSDDAVLQYKADHPSVAVFVYTPDQPKATLVEGAAFEADGK